MSLLEQVAERAPFDAAGGRTGAAFERATLADGTTLVLKHVRPDDWVVRATGGQDRMHVLWSEGVLADVPADIDHAVVGVERDADGWVVVMRDVSDTMLGDHRRLSRSDNEQVLRALAGFHATFAGQEHPDGLCSLFDHYAVVTPRGIAASGTNSPVGPLIVRGWELFADVAPPDVAEPLLALVDDVRPLVRELQRSPQTLLHGDVRLHNMGLTDDRVVLIDWEVAGPGPSAVDFAWYLIISATRVDATREEILDDHRRIAGDAYDERAMEVALIGALCRLGWNKALDIVENPDPAVRAQERADLDWWVSRVRTAFETWGP